MKKIPKQSDQSDVIKNVTAMVVEDDDKGFAPVIEVTYGDGRRELHQSKKYASSCADPDDALDIANATYDDFMEMVEMHGTPADPRNINPDDDCDRLDEWRDRAIDAEAWIKMESDWPAFERFSKGSLPPGEKGRW